MQGGWTGELNYAITRLIQVVPYEMCRPEGIGKIRFGIGFMPRPVRRPDPYGLRPPRRHGRRLPRKRLDRGI